MKVVGVDLGIAKLALSVWVDGELHWCDSYDLARKGGFRGTTLMELCDFIYEDVATADPDFVFIEEPLVGNNHKYSMQLSQTYGAVLACLALLCTTHGFEVIPVNVSTWKKQTIGDGHANKEAIRSWADEQSEAYALHCGDNQDRYDAAVIGFYGHQIVERAAQLMGDV